MDRNDVILIGPTGVGKTTVGRLLAETLHMPLLSLDEVRYPYYQELDYDEAKAKWLKQHNFEELIQYWQPFDAHAVVRVLAEYQGFIFDFGAIHSVYEDPTLFHIVEEALRPCPNVVLLLPSCDMDESVRVLHERGAGATRLDQESLDMWYRIVERFVRHPSNARLAKHTIYTMGLTPHETMTRIFEVLHLSLFGKPRQQMHPTWRECM